MYAVYFNYPKHTGREIFGREIFVVNSSNRTRGYIMLMQSLIKAPWKGDAPVWFEKQSKIKVD